MLRKRHVASRDAAAYATDSDFCRIFNDEMGGLYLLALLLCANHESAERCFLAALQDCMDRNRIFKEWARSWSRRMIVQNAIRLMTPRPEEDRKRSQFTCRQIENTDLGVESLLASLLELTVFDRFVFVMSVLEKYSVHDCSLLLEKSRRIVSDARERALGCFANLMMLCTRQLGARPLVLVRPDGYFGLIRGDDSLSQIET